MFLTALSSFVKESGLRKVGSCLSIFFTCAFLLLRGVLPASDFVTVTLVVLAGLVGGNAIERALNAKVEAGKGKEPTDAKPIVPVA